MFNTHRGDHIATNANEICSDDPRGTVYARWPNVDHPKTVVYATPSAHSPAPPTSRNADGAESEQARAMRQGAAGVATTTLGFGPSPWERVAALERELREWREWAATVYGDTGRLEAMTDLGLRMSVAATHDREVAAARKERAA